MTAEALLSEIKKGAFTSPYLFHGVEEYTKDVALERLKAKLIDPGLEELNFQSLSAAGMDETTLSTACRTLPFMSEYRLVVIYDLNFMVSGSEKTEATEKNNPKAAMLAEELDHLPPSTILVLMVRGESKKNSLYKKIDKGGTVVAFEQLDDNMLQKWIASRLALKQKKIDPTTAAYLIGLSGKSMYKLQGELDKLAANTKGEFVDKPTIDAVVNPQSNTNIFTLVDAVGNRKTETALFILEQCYREGKTEYDLLAVFQMVVRQVRQLLRVRELMDEGAQRSEMLKALALPPSRDFILKKLLQQARNFSARRLRAALLYCGSIDTQIKTGLIGVKCGLELIIIKLTA